MTKEQEEAIERLNKLKSRNILYGNRAGMIIEDFKTLQNDIETVLEMIKEKSAELEKKDKIIDLMARAFKQDDVRSIEEIKQYFERKVKDEL